MAEQNGDGRTQAAIQAAQYDAALQQFHAAQEVARNRTLEEHDRHLRQYGGGEADRLSKRSYMLEHGLEYRHGVLVWSPSTIYSEAGRDARIRNARIAAPIGGLNTTGMPHAFPRLADGAGGVMQNVAHGDSVLRADIYKDRPLVDALCARLAGYCGEGGRNEGAVETLDRLLSEVRAARQGPSAPPPQNGPHSTMLGQEIGGHIGQLSSGEPGKMFSRETILAILRAQQCINATHKVPGMREGGDDVLRALLTIFENLETP